MTGPERERFETLVTAAVDGELDEEGRAELEGILAADPSLRRELEQHRRVKEVVGAMSFVKPPEEVWDRYRRTVLHRLERSAGWVLLTMGLALLLGYGAYRGLLELLRSEDVALWVKLGIGAVLCGTAVLLGSVIRERLFLRRRERYDEVQR